MNEPVNVTLSRKVRPLRLAFLVQPSRRDQLIRAIEINTILWGGRYNPIIPVYGRTPSSWGRKPVPTARQIIEGYVEAFDPDFIVNMTNKPIAMAGYESEGYRKRMLSVNDVIDPKNQSGAISFGMDVTELYEHLYTTVYRFQRKNPIDVLLPAGSDRSMEHFTAAAYGRFPLDKELSYVKQTYLDVFDAKDFSVQPADIYKPLARETSNPLRMGSAFVEFGYTPQSQDTPTIFYFDAHDTMDIIDYWNLRAAGGRILPVPKQWADQHIDFVQKFIRSNYSPYKHNPKMMHHTTLQKGRSLRDSELDDYRKTLKVEPQEMLGSRHWYPRIWDEWARGRDYVEPVEIYSDEERIELACSEGRIMFRDKRPIFVDRRSHHHNPRWANVIVLSTYGADDEHAAVIPVGLPDVGRIIGTLGNEFVRAGRDGLVMACEYTNFTHHWNLPLSSRIFDVWSKAYGLAFTFSDAGYVTQQLIRQLEGVRGSWIFAHTEILKLFERMARGEALPVGEMRTRVNALYDARDIRHADRHMKLLVDKKILRLGVELQCDHCRQRTWFPLESMKETIRCEKCLGYFPFPACCPPLSPWYFRTAGPFSIQHYCHGAYCVSLGMRFFAQILHGTVTSIPSFKLTSRDGGELEVDFGAFYRSDAWYEREPYLILAECKTFDRFTQTDVRRMRRMGKQFPGAVLVFCTLNEELTPAEKRLLRPLAMTGRKYMGEEKWLHPVLLLTRTELFGDNPPPYAWEHAGGKYAEFAQKHSHLGTLFDLCDATQQLHLDMKSYWETREESMQRRLERMRQKQTKAADV